MDQWHGPPPSDSGGSLPDSRRVPGKRAVRSRTGRSLAARRGGTSVLEVTGRGARCSGDGIPRWCWPCSEPYAHPTGPVIVGPLGDAGPGRPERLAGQGAKRRSLASIQ